jgi:hypothetical protein
MIFFSVPSVGQLKPETLFGGDNHLGFIQTVIGNEYDNNAISGFCQEYYSTGNEKYWGQIITLINFLGLKKLDNENRFLSIPLMDAVARDFDEGKTDSSDALFNYFLCKWQFPHPINTNRVAERQYPAIKPYRMLLSILRVFYMNDPASAYLTNDEFYWLGRTYLNNNGEGFDDNSLPNLAEEIIEFRAINGWEGYNEIENPSVHLSYPKGFLKNSSILTDDSDQFVTVRPLFIGLISSPNTLDQIDGFIETSHDIFEFEPSDARNLLAYNWSEYLYNSDSVRDWLRVSSYGLDTIKQFDIPEVVPSDGEGETAEEYKIRTQLERIGSLDKETVVRRRTEQHILKKYLFNNAGTGSCALCRQEFPITFLTTAHIKKRSECTDEEKRDMNIVMPACNLGCDILYEKGYLLVRDGIVRENIGIKPVSTALRNYVSKQNEKECAVFNGDRAGYFKHHEEQNEI